MQTKDNYRSLGRSVIETEVEAIRALIERIDDKFSTACDELVKCSGRIVVLGMGKSGHICKKIAATLASTGSPSFFVHPGEANHGDVGMITKHDVILAISNSGETNEILTLLPLIKRLNIPLIAMTGAPKSTLAKMATVNIDVSVEKEACPLGLAPTSSTTVSLVMGDALAIAVLEAKGFTADDFAMSHPGGALGRRLLLRINDVMHIGDSIPHINKSEKLSEALVEMTQKGLGMTTIVDEQRQLQGIYTDGDLRRCIDKDIDIHATNIGDVMTKNFKTISSNMLAAEALQIMQSYKITSLPVVTEGNILEGIVHLHDLLRSGVI